jgi:hypothetical protein
MDEIRALRLWQTSSHTLFNDGGICADSVPYFSNIQEFRKKAVEKKYDLIVLELGYGIVKTPANMKTDLVDMFMENNYYGVPLFLVKEIRDGINKDTPVRVIYPYNQLPIDTTLGKEESPSFKRTILERRMENCFMEAGATSFHRIQYFDDYPDLVKKFANVS